MSEKTFMKTLLIGSITYLVIILVGMIDYNERNEALSYEDFKFNSGKYVRANHVQADFHWTEH